MLSVSKLERQRTSGPQKRTKSDFMYCSQHLGASSRNPRRNPRCPVGFGVPSKVMVVRVVWDVWVVRLVRVVKVVWLVREVWVVRLVRLAR